MVLTSGRNRESLTVVPYRALPHDSYPAAPRRTFANILLFDIDTQASITRSTQRIQEWMTET
jgi:hypothetical protein